MENNPPSEPDPKTVIDLLTRIVNESTAPLMAGFSQVQQQRFERLAAGAERLKGELGEDHPLVVDLSQKAAAADTSYQAFKTEATRAARIPQVSPNDWLVYGQVIDSLGRPVIGVTVRVFDRDRKYDDLLGETTTDEFGDFSLIYHDRDFAEVREARPDLYLVVIDYSGKEIYSSRENVSYEAGRAEYFEIVLPEMPEQTKAGRKKQARKRK